MANLRRLLGEQDLATAQDIMYEAWEAQGARRVALARKARQVSHDCADAYVLLAEETARSLTKARDLYAQGVAAGPGSRSASGRWASARLRSNTTRICCA